MSAGTSAPDQPASSAHVAPDAHRAARLNVSRWALEHAALTRYLLVVLLVLGAVAYFQLGQDEDPPFTFRAMALRVYWPGATAQQVAEQVTDKLERTLQEVPYADRIRSYSKPGEALITFQVKDSSPPKEMPQIWYTVRKKIGDMRATLPAGVIGPAFNDEFGDVYGTIFALSADGFSYQELKDEADRVRQRLLKVKDVNKVSLFGVQDEKVWVEISQKRLAQLGLDFNQVLQQLGQQNAVESAGTLVAPTDILQVRVAGQFQSVDALKAFPIRAGGSSLRLGDIADIHRGYVDPPQVKVRHDGHEVLALGISMARGGDIIELGRALDRTAAQIRADLPAGIELHRVQDQAQVVSSSITEFIDVLVEAIAVVLAVSFVSLGLHTRPLRIDWRPGLVVAITIPLVLA
ncbi:MAG TPA: efflux RND transporter permease subunit, partial [Caldimonas sp.]|nr:efflux RND transporter permease subunit [Caldimonas sp.]